MKALYLIRHAKSDWSQPHQADFDRALNARGQRAAPAMAARLARWPERPELLLSSPACRARQTAVAFAAALQLPPARLWFDARLYATGPEVLLEILQQLDGHWQGVGLIGHNPALEQLGQWLCPAAPEHLPTCALLHLRLAVPLWRALAPGCGQLQAYDFPKNPVIAAPA